MLAAAGADDFFNVRYTNLCEDGIRAELIRRGATPTAELIAGSKRLLEDIRHGRKWVEPQRAQLAHQAAARALEVAPFLFERAWAVYTSPPMLLTTDEPVVPLEGPGALREERGGLGSAGIVIYPLGPTKLLAMVRPDIATAWGIENHTDRVYHVASHDAATPDQTQPSQTTPPPTPAHPPPAPSRKSSTSTLPTTRHHRLGVPTRDLPTQPGAPSIAPQYPPTPTRSVARKDRSHIVRLEDPGGRESPLQPSQERVRMAVAAKFKNCSEIL
jgi:hypothetical protein